MGGRVSPHIALTKPHLHRQLDHHSHSLTRPLSLPSVLHDDNGSPYYGNPSLKIVQREHPSFVVQSRAVHSGSSMGQLPNATLSAASVTSGSASRRDIEHIDVVDITPDPQERTTVNDSRILAYAKNHKLAFDFGAAFREKKLVEEVMTSSDRKAKKGFSLKTLLFG
jgi:hypothetical protein